MNLKYAEQNTKQNKMIHSEQVQGKIHALYISFSFPLPLLETPHNWLYQPLHTSAVQGAPEGTKSTPI